MDVDAYIRRLGFRGSLAPTLQTLRALHRAHLLAVPFENLDIPLGRPIVLDESLLFEKIVNRRRGGFCYELNGLFAALLRELGFKVQRLSARVSNGEGGFGIEFDHMALLVQLEESWLADVGFGDSFLEPLRLSERGEQIQDRGRYRIAAEGEGLLYLKEEGGAWMPQYLFTLQPRALADFAGGCHYHQSSPDSHFTRRRVCSRATPAGRITLSDMRLIVTADGGREERLLAGDDEVQEVLREQFDVVF